MRLYTVFTITYIFLIPDSIPIYFSYKKGLYLALYIDFIRN